MTFGMGRRSRDAGERSNSTAGGEGPPGAAAGLVFLYLGFGFFLNLVPARRLLSVCLWRWPFLALLVVY
jgi:hypothetical protein